MLRLLIGIPFFAVFFLIIGLVYIVEGVMFGVTATWHWLTG